MTDGTGIAFDHALRVAEQEYALAEQDGRLTWRHRFDLKAARVRASSAEGLADALTDAAALVAEWRKAKGVR